MPSAYQGSPTTPSNTNWQSTHAYLAGHLVQPSPNTGQYFQAQGNGTSGSTQPAWSTPSALPVPGTTFVDGSVTWTCMGSIVADPISTITIDEPLDSDPTVTVIIARALKNLANYIAAILVTSNTWTAEQDFQGGIDVSNTNVGQSGVDATGGSSAGTGVAAHGGTGGGDGVFATGDTTGAGGQFTGGATGFSGTQGAGVIGVGGAAGGVGGDFTGGAGGAIGVAGHGVGLAGVFGNSDVAEGGKFDANATRGSINLTPIGTLPSNPAVGDICCKSGASAGFYFCLTAGSWSGPLTIP